MLRSMLRVASPAGRIGRLSIRILHRVLPVPDLLLLAEVEGRYIDGICGWAKSRFSVLAPDNALIEVIDGLSAYIHERLHSMLGYLRPIKFEANWHAGQSQKAARPAGYGLCGQGQGQTSGSRAIMAFIGAPYGRRLASSCGAPEIARNPPQACVA